MLAFLCVLIFLFVLVVVSMLAAFAVAVRLAEKRDEVIIIQAVVWTTMVVGPLYVFGLTNMLTKGAVAASTLLLSTGSLVLSLRGRGREHIDEFRKRLQAMVLVPVDAMRITWRADALLTIPLTVAMAYFVWQIVAAYFGPCWGDWDALWYHEPIIAWSIQNKGFDPVPLPLGHQLINGYTRFGEATMTFWGLFGGRRVVDMSNFVFLPMFLASMHGLASRFTRDRVVPIGFAIALMLMPGTMRQLRSTMVDVEGGALMAAAIYFVTHPQLTRTRMVLFLLAVTAAIGVKSVIVPSGAVACLVFFVRALLHRRQLGGRWLCGLIFGGGVLVLSMLASTHLRNWFHYRNPIWPVSLEIEKWGIHWPGAFPYVTDKKGATTGQVDVNLPLDGLLERLLARPYTVIGQGHTWHVDDYGFGMSWVSIPIAVIACFSAPVVWGGRRIRERVKKLEQQDATKLAAQAASIALFAIAGYKFSPSVHVPRYMLAPLVAGLTTIVWFMSGYRWRRGLHSVIFFSQVGSILMTVWATEPRRWYYTPKEMVSLIRTPYPARESARKFGAPVNDPVAMAREREIGPGDVVLFDDSEVWPAMAWNNDFSNRAYWIDDTKDAMQQVVDRNAKWVLTRPGTHLSSQLVATGWQPVGLIENEQWTMAYRRPL